MGTYSRPFSAREDRKTWTPGKEQPRYVERDDLDCQKRCAVAGIAVLLWAMAVCIFTIR
jgi:hypothetical protein